MAHQPEVRRAILIRPWRDEPGGWNGCDGPLALIVHELATNALKHGRHADGTGLQIRLGRSSDGCRLAVRNAGALPAGFDPAACEGFGMRMVAVLTQQLSGRLEAACLGGESEITVSFRPKLAQPAMSTIVAAPAPDTAERVPSV